jgi:hypothetical protein
MTNQRTLPTRHFAAGEIICWAQHTSNLLPAIAARGWHVVADQPESEDSAREVIWAFPGGGNCHLLVDPDTRVIFAIFTGSAAAAHFDDVRSDGLLATWGDALKELRETSSPAMASVFVDALGVIAPLEPEASVSAALCQMLEDATDSELQTATVRAMLRLQWPTFRNALSRFAQRLPADNGLRPAIEQWLAVAPAS